MFLLSILRLLHAVIDKRKSWNAAIKFLELGKIQMDNSIPSGGDCAKYQGKGLRPPPMLSKLDYWAIAVVITSILGLTICILLLLRQRRLLIRATEMVSHRGTARHFRYGRWRNEHDLDQLWVDPLMFSPPASIRADDQPGASREAMKD